MLIGFGKVITFANHLWVAPEVIRDCTRWCTRSGVTSAVVRAEPMSTLDAQLNDFGARNLPCSAVMRPTVMGRRKRRGPALPDCVLRR